MPSCYQPHISTFGLVGDVLDVDRHPPDMFSDVELLAGLQRPSEISKVGFFLEKHICE